MHNNFISVKQLNQQPYPWKFYSNYALIFLLSLSYCLLFPMPTLADDQGYGFNGSEFNATPYRDAELMRHEFREWENGTSRSDNGFETRRKPKWSLKELHKEKHDKEKSEEEVGERKTFEEERKYAPIHELAGDWVPSAIDVKNSGVFSIEPFNGSPVPYDLNGHVDTESGGEYQQYQPSMSAPE